MKKIIMLMLVLVVFTSCVSPYAYYYSRNQVVPSVPQTIQKKVLVSYDNGITFVEETVTIVAPSNQVYMVNNYFNAQPRWLVNTNNVPGTNWIASPVRAHLETGGQFGQYLFQDFAINFLLRDRQIRIRR